MHASYAPVKTAEKPKAMPPLPETTKKAGPPKPPPASAKPDPKQASPPPQKQEIITELKSAPAVNEKDDEGKPRPDVPQRPQTLLVKNSNNEVSIAKRSASSSSSGEDEVFEDSMEVRTGEEKKVERVEEIEDSVEIKDETKPAEKEDMKVETAAANNLASPVSPPAAFSSQPPQPREEVDNRRFSELMQSMPVPPWEQKNQEQEEEASDEKPAAAVRFIQLFPSSFWVI